MPLKKNDYPLSAMRIGEYILPVPVARRIAQKTYMEHGWQIMSWIVGTPCPDHTIKINSDAQTEDVVLDALFEQWRNEKLIRCLGREKFEEIQRELTRLDDDDDED